MFVTLLPIAMFFAASSCKPEDEIGHKFFIKYEVVPRQADYGQKFTVTFMDIDGEKQHTARAYYQNSIGPVKDGFQAYIFPQYPGKYEFATVRIYVSRDGEPFALRAKGTKGMQEYFVNANQWK